jgi:predicted GH43/DUF377 family glycosyl hydrolase
VTLPEVLPVAVPEVLPVAVPAALVCRGGPELRPDQSRVLLRLFLPGQELPIRGMSRRAAILARVLDLTPEQVRRTLAVTLATFEGRDEDLLAAFRENYVQVRDGIPESIHVEADRADLIGAYFTQAYALEAAALFNPSIVAHPDQTGLAEGETRFVLSLRAVGEGHISCLEFRTGVAGPGHRVRVDPPGLGVQSGHVSPRPMTRRTVLEALAAAGDTADAARLRRIQGSSYQVHFPPESLLSERVLFPASEDERNGIEDARFVRFVDDDGSVTYYATYTAYDGARVSPHLLRTRDFRVFQVSGQIGPAATDKGMALFPRKVGGRFLALTRWDRETISVARSVDAFAWSDPVSVQAPTHPWEIVQLGACAPPIETPDGWLVITHGVGPLRRYAIAATLLDLHDPTRVLGVLREPLLVPVGDERVGYVPNVVYSCGALLHEGTVILPYGCSDTAVRFAFVDLAGLLTLLRESPPPARH